MIPGSFLSELSCIVNKCVPIKFCWTLLLPLLLAYTGVNELKHPFLITIETSIYFLTYMCITVIVLVFIRPYLADENLEKIISQKFPNLVNAQNPLKLNKNCILIFSWNFYVITF
jgi:hypothetical protein